MDVKVLNTMNYYLFYLDIIECESLIKNLIRASMNENLENTQMSEGIKESFCSNECTLCYKNRVSRFFRCKVHLYNS